PATSVCTDEVLTVNKASPTAATQVKRSSDNSNVADGGGVAIGTSVYDTASLTGGFNAGGTAEYFYKKQTSSTLDCTGGSSLGTKTVTSGSVANSEPVTLNEAGTYEFWVVYGGDSNNNTATSTCGSETVVVNPNSPTASTAQTLIPNDSLTLSGATTTAGGTVDFYLFAPGETCSAANTAGLPAARKFLDRPLDATKTASTNNTTFIASAEGTWTWYAVYEGDANNNPAASNCVETFSIDNNTSTP
ncbi:MAG: hypothetical protein ACLGHT_13375, partial [Acidimicrobiia bacterium]